MTGQAQSPHRTAGHYIHLDGPSCSSGRAAASYRAAGYEGLEHECIKDAFSFSACDGV